MSAEMKHEIDAIPIPPHLKDRIRQGAAQAGSERRKRNATRLSVAAAAIAAILLFTSLFHDQVSAAIQKALQFIPGLGIVSEEEVPTERYILQDPVTVEMDGGTVQITGISVDDKQVEIMVSANNSPRFTSVTLINDKGVKYQIPSAMSSWSSRDWEALFWLQGTVDAKDNVRLIFEGKPEISIPIHLTKAKSFASYEDMGETSRKNGLAVTAIASKFGNKARVSLVTGNSKDFRISDYGYVLYNQKTEPITVTDENGTKYETQWIRGITAPLREFTFELPAVSAKKYKVTIPQINVEYPDSTDLKLDIPEPGASLHVKQTFTLAGFPADVTKIERDGEKSLKVYVDFHYNDQAPMFLHDFRLGTQSSMAKLNDQTGVMEYFAFAIDPGAKQVTVKLEDARVVVRGPWVFEIDAEKYLGSKQP